MISEIKLLKKQELKNNRWIELGKIIKRECHHYYEKNRDEDDIEIPATVCKSANDYDILTKCLCLDCPKCLKALASIRNNKLDYSHEELTFLTKYK